MKTTKQWLESLNEPYKSEALSNMIKGVSDAKVKTMSEALLTAFPWNHTKQGFQYWDELFRQAIKNQ